MELAIKKEEKTENPYVLAISSAKVSELSKPDMVKRLIDIISISFYEAGQTIKGPNEAAQAAELKTLAFSVYNDIKSNFKYLRADEVALAFRNGVRKDYGEYFGLNTATFYGWLKAYSASERRKDALQRQKSESEYVKPIMTKDEAEYAWKQSIEARFKAFKETGVLNIEFPGFVFDYFEETGRVTLTKSEKEEIFKEARQRVCEEAKLRRINPRSKNELSNLTALIKRFEEDCETKDDIKRVKVEAKRLAVKRYFESIDELKF